MASSDSSDRFGSFSSHPGRGQSPTAHGSAALKYGLVKQTFAGRRQQMVSRASGTRTLTEYRHAVRIASELADVFSDPAQRHHLVLHPEVAGQDVVFGANKP